MWLVFGLEKSRKQGAVVMAQVRKEIEAISTDKLLQM